MSGVGIVVIGRNEGDRLRRCLASLGQRESLVYVDSNSTDGSAELAESLGIDTYRAPSSFVQTAALAREVGWRALMRKSPDLEYIQFVDGDCLLAENWIESACAFLENHSDVAVVFGQRREESPRLSLWTRLCEMEWRHPAGDALACGGDALYRRQNLERVGGFRSELISWEEPELCLRLRKAGARIACLDVPMTVHLGAPRGWLGWWKRNQRAGLLLHAIDLHPGDADAAWLKSTRSNWGWGLALPLVALLGSLLDARAIALLLAWSLPAARAYRWRRTRFSESRKSSALYGVFCALGKIAQASGQLAYAARFPSRRKAKTAFAV